MHPDVARILLTSLVSLCPFPYVLMVRVLPAAEASRCLAAHASSVASAKVTADAPTRLPPFHRAIHSRWGHAGLRSCADVRRLFLPIVASASPLLSVSCSFLPPCIVCCVIHLSYLLYCVRFMLLVSCSRYSVDAVKVLVFGHAILLGCQSRRR